MERRFFLLLAIAACFGLFNVWFTDSLHQNSTFFTHLTETEREITFRTEMAFYYSFFKQIVHNMSFLSLIHDTQTEFPAHLNSLERFNLFPELFLGYLYILIRDYTPLFSEIQCYGIERNVAHMSHDRAKKALSRFYVYVLSCPQEKNHWLAAEPNVASRNLADASPRASFVEIPASAKNCVGWTEPSVFYTRAVFLLAFLTQFSLALSAFHLLSKKSDLRLVVLAPFLVCTSFVTFQNYATRVQWTPPLRESFAFPFFVLQQSVLLGILRSRNPSSKQLVLFSVTQLCFQLPWQFSQFALTTQILALFGALLLTFFLGQEGESCVSVTVINRLAITQLGSFLASWMLQYGNCLLLTGIYPPVLLSVILLTTASHFRKVGLLCNLALLWLLVLAFSLVIRSLVQSSLFACNPKDGDHILDLLKLKLITLFSSNVSSYRTFHTQLYVCAAEFDFMPIKKLLLLAWTMPLLQLAGVYLLFTLYNTTGSRRKSFARHLQRFYMILQLFAFFVLAMFIDRMRLFFVPHLCLMVALWCHDRFPWALNKPMKNIKLAVLIALAAIAATKSYNNATSMLHYHGEVADEQIEAMLLWFQQLPPKGDDSEPWVISGPMTTLSNLRNGLIASNPGPNLPTFAITNHPHYENADLRQKTILAYSIYSKMPLPMVWYIYSRILKADFLLVEAPWCFQEYAKDCMIGDLYKFVSEEELQALLGTKFIAKYDEGEYLCNRLRLNTKSMNFLNTMKPYFTEVFSDTNRFRVVLKVNSLSVST